MSSIRMGSAPIRKSENSSILAASVAALSLGSTMAVAEGLERVNLDTSFMYENGTHAEFSFGSVNPSIPADWTGGGSSKNLASSFAVSNFAAKTSLGDKFDIGLWRTNNSNGVAVDWGPTFPIAADLTVSGLVGLVRYSVSDNFSVMAGLKRLQSDAGASVSVPLGETPAGLTGAPNFLNANASLGVASYTIPSASATTSVYGIAYERPEIAMRLELLLEGETEITPHAIVLEYLDGFKATVLRAGRSDVRWNFACRLKGNKKPLATSFYVGPWNNRNLFKALSHAIQVHFRTGTPPYPVERTYFVSGILDAAMKARKAPGHPLHTNQLHYRYQASDFSHVRENGDSWKIITEDIPQPPGFNNGTPAKDQ